MSQIEEWTAFVRVVEAESFSRAAERLGVAKSVVSRRVSDLEARLGTQLLTRTTRRLGITPAGRGFYESCLRLLAEIDEMEASIRDDTRIVTGRLRIAIPNGFATRHLARPLAQFAEKHAGLQLEMEASDRFVDLIEEGYDMAVRIGRLMDPSLIARRLAPSRHTVTASKAYWKRHGIPQHPDELTAHRHIRDTLTATPGRLAWRHPDGGEGTVEPPHCASASSGELALELASEGLGFVAGPSFLSAGMIASGKLVPVLTGYVWSEGGIYAVYPPTRHRAFKVRAAIEHLVETFAGEPPWDRAISKTIGHKLPKAD